MRTQLLTEEDLADRLQATLRQVREWRRQYDWPCIKLGRSVRFSEDDLRAIVAAHHVAANPRERGLPGQTPLSIARNR